MRHKSRQQEAGPGQSPIIRPDTAIPQAWVAGSLHYAAAADRQIVFIDGSLADAQLLAAGVKPGVIAVVLDPTGNELQQIALYLASHPGQTFAAIDVVAHGTDGAITLGNTVLDASTVPQYASDLAAIGAALQPGGAIQLFGCDVAQDAIGMAFLQQLSDAAGGADIAAASHLVGAAAGGGSWTLDADIGTVTATAPFTATALAAYQGELSSGASGTLWLGSWNGLTNSNLNQLDALSMSGASPGTTTDVADTLKTGDSSLNVIDSLAIDPVTGEAFILGIGGNDQGANIARVPTAGGTYTLFYSAPDTAVNGGDGDIGAIAVDEANGNVYFTQQDFVSSTGAQIAADTGIFAIPEAGGTATQVIAGVTSGTTLTNPTSLVLDVPDNLAFFVENDSYPGASGTAELYVGSLIGGGLAPLLTIPIGAYNTNDTFDTSLAIDPASHTLYFATGQFGSTSADGIYSVHYTLSGSLATVGSVSTLYLGAAAQDPYAIAVDPANGLLFVTGTTVGNSGSSDAASAWVGSTSGGSTLTEILQLGGQTIGDYSYTNAAVFEATPSISASGSVIYSQGGAAVTLDAALTVSDASEPDLASATVSIGGYVSGDTLTVGTLGGLSQSFSNGTLVLSGNLSVVTYQTALESVAFSTTAGAGSRTIDWTVNDGLIASTTPTSTVSVHTAPTVTAGGTVAFTGGGSAVTLDSGLSVSDASSTTLSSATVSIVGFINVDTLSVGTAGGLGTSYSNGTLTLTGFASLATYQTALDSVEYSVSPADGDPTGGGSHTSRTISWVVNDGVASSATADSTLDTVHAAPTITAGGTVDFTGGGAAVTLDAGLSVSDPDSGGTLASATVAISSGFLTGDTLNFADTANITGIYANGTLTLTGSDSIADYQTALQSVTYGFSGDPTDGGTDTSRTISWSVSDGVAGSAPADSSLTTQCFCAGTRIATPDGEVPVEALRPGDLVRLADGGTAPVRWMGRHAVARHFSDPLRDWPIRVSAGALAEGVPCRDLLLSPGHALRVGNVLAHAGALVNGISIVREQRVPETFVYWHVELDTHALVLAEGAPAETFLDTYEELAFDNRASRPAPSPGSMELPYPRCKSPRQLPHDLREALAARAALIRPARAAA